MYAQFIAQVTFCADIEQGRNYLSRYSSNLKGVYEDFRSLLQEAERLPSGASTLKLHVAEFATALKNQFPSLYST